MRPRRIEAIKWSPEMAYIVGLMAADGCLSKDGRHLILTSQDIQLLRVFKKCLGLKVKIGTKRNGISKRTYYQVQFGDVVLYRWFLKIGLTPRKSKTINKLTVPKKYFFDLLRGEFDGDGSCYSYWDKRWDSSFMFYTAFCSGSQSHVEWFRKELELFLKIKGHVDQNGEKKVWMLKYAKRESKILIPKMYYKNNLPCLERKHRKLKLILNTDQKELRRKV